MSRYVIGDIHGHRVALESLLAALPLTPDDELIFLGDYVDKGPDVRGVLDLLAELSKRPNTVFLRGNHDQMLIDAYREPVKFAIWECLAGRDPLASYGSGSLEELIQAIPADHLEFLERACVDWHETREFIFVHGGIRPSVAPAEEDREHLHWTSLSMALPHSSGRTVICGHTRNEFGRIADLGHTICIDTGISHDGVLTCLELTGFQFWQANREGGVTEGWLQRESGSQA